MKTQAIKATQGQGLIVCIMIEGNNPGMPPQQQPNRDREEQNLPDPEEYNEGEKDEDLEDIPMEEPIPDIDEIEEEEIIDPELEEDTDRERLMDDQNI